LDLEPLEEIPHLLEVDKGVKPVALPSGTEAARERLENFLKEKLNLYADSRLSPFADVTSGLSPYLHFGQISPVEVALAIKEAGGRGADAFLEQLVVRRELALNFVWYSSHYESFQGLPTWARKSLLRHRLDPRPQLYRLEDLESDRTHDPIWNMAQSQLSETDHLHIYLRQIPSQALPGTRA
jgi:deoxyribodipyrimidine photo-lyase